MNGDKKKKRSGGGWAIFAVIIGAVISALGDLDGTDAFGFIVVIVILAMVGGVFGLIFALIKKASNAATDSGKAEGRPLRRERMEDFPRYARQLENREPRRDRREADRPVRARREGEDRPSIFRREPLEDKPISHQRELLPMDEYERQKRLEQLENFLKNGTIDKDEYRKLRARYER